MAVPPEALTKPNAESSPTNGEDVLVLNGNEYIFELVLFNGDIAIRIPNRIVHELTIVDSIYSIFHYGHLILKNEFNAVENFTTSNGTSQELSIRETSYLFKSNTAGDTIIVKMKPKFPPFNADSLDDATWSLSFMFSIYDEDEIHNASGTEKLKIFKFKDIRDDILSNTFTPWSTSDVLAKQNQSSFNITQISNNGRAVKTGAAIQDILTSTLADFSVTFDDAWDPGNTTVFYSQPYDACRFDALEYVLDQHVAFNTGDNCFLKFERSGKWSLLPVETYFKRALKKEQNLPGDFTVDIFHLHVQENVENQTQFKVPAQSKVAYDVRIPLQEFTGLYNYGFVNITGADSTRELVTTPVHSVDLRKKQFSVDLTDNSIIKVQDTFQKMYIDKMFGSSPTNTIPINPQKEKNLLYAPVYSLYNSKSQRIKEGRGKIMQKALAFSHGLTFNLEGFTIRRSGRFISVVNTGSFPENTFQNTIQGEWFITQVSHTIVGNTYRNEIIAIKPYTYKNF